MKQPGRLAFVFLTVLFCALLGGVYGQRVEATSVAEESEVQASLRTFTTVFQAVEQNYADRVDTDRALFGASETDGGAIPGMLQALDPHSTFFDRRHFTELKEQMQGRYYGVGMRIQSRPGKGGKLITIVFQPIPGSPAFRAGLRPGDIIVRVDSKPVIGLDSAKVADLLKGPKGTVVHVSVSREGSDQPLEFTITRDEISPRSVDDAFFIRPGVAYIHIANFTETTDEELTEILKTLDPRTWRGLILDLRNNGGGLLQEAVAVASHFLEKNQLVVYDSGRRSREKRYYVTKAAKGSDYPMVVLINRFTASASEIVTGALQDHDRALVMGEPSFGKGLVQTEFPLSERTMLLLTTARYFTPSGRLIQRDYTNVSLYDYYYRSEATPTPRTEVRLTDGGREVYGGGGITPDVQVSEEELNPVQKKLLAHAAFFNFGKFYLGIHQTVPRDFQVTDQVMDDFRRFLAKEHVSLSNQDIQQNLDYIRNRIRFQLVTAIYGQTEGDRLDKESDPLVLKALDSLDNARQLMARARKYMALKRQ
jgi:carboxyl-terminal processing protease